MCLGIPMQIVSCQGSTALCETQGVQHQIDLSLVGGQPAGQWVLVFLGAAREVISSERAKQVQQALLAVESVMRGEPMDLDLDLLFADLVNREPKLPDHLKASLESSVD